MRLRAVARKRLSSSSISCCSAFLRLIRAWALSPPFFLGLLSPPRVLARLLATLLLRLLLALRLRLLWLLHLL